MAERIVRGIAIVTSALVLVSFALFARDQFADASETQQAIAAGVDYTLPTPKREAQPRRFIDGSARVLLKPFAFASTSQNAWGQRSVPTLIALLVYGFGLGFAARSVRWVRPGPRAPDPVVPHGTSTPPPS